MITKRQAKREAKQLFRRCLVDDLLDESRIRKVAHHVAVAGYRDCPPVFESLVRLVRLYCGQHSATIESATPLASDLQTAIQAGLTRHYGPGLTTAFAHQPSLIGGMRIQVGSDVYDGSVRGALATLEKSF